MRRVWVSLAVLLLIAGDASAQTQRQRREQQQREQQQREQQQREQEQREREQQLQQQQPTPPPPQAAPAPAPAPQPAPPPAPAPAAPARTAAEPPPVPVRVVPTPKTEAELAAERQERERRSATDTRLLILAALLVAIGFFQFVAFSIQALYVWLALRALRRSSLQSERNMRAAQRAFVHVGSVAWSPAGPNVKVSPAWTNNGTTPTRGLRVSTSWKAWHGELPADFGYPYTRPPDRLFLGPKGQSDIGSVLIPMRDIQAALEERVQVYFWGRATYEDIFEGSQPHFIEFCYQLDVKGTAPNFTIGFSHYGAHNRTDEDSQRPVVLEQR